MAILTEDEARSKTIKAIEKQADAVAEGIKTLAGLTLSITNAGMDKAVYTGEWFGDPRLIALAMRTMAASHPRWAQLLSEIAKPGPVMAEKLPQTFGRKVG